MNDEHKGVKGDESLNCSLRNGQTNRNKTNFHFLFIYVREQKDPVSFHV